MQHSQPTLDFVGSKVYAWLGVTSHPHFWQNDRGLLRATEVTRRGVEGGGAERTPKKSQHTKFTPEKKNSPAAPAGIRTRNLYTTSEVLLVLLASYPGSLVINRPTSEL